MSKIIYVDLEDLPQRYSSMMNRAIKPYVDTVISGPVWEDNQIKVGEFLDVNRTIAYKAYQLAAISNLFERGEVRNDDIFLIGDIFFPGIESIRYMAELQNIRIKMFGFNYAGRADATDFVQNLGVWSDSSELGYHKCMDGVFVGSEFHRKNILNYFGIERMPTIYVTGYVYDRSYIDSVYMNLDPVKQDYVIWPHRLAKEKGLAELDLFASLTDKKIIITSSGKKNAVGVHFEKKHHNIEYRTDLKKWEYYELMSKAKYYLSTAYQETFGYTLQEAIHFGCRIAVPDRACYSEMVTLPYIYKNVNDIEKCWEHEPLDKYYTEIWNNNIYKVISIIRR